MYSSDQCCGCWERSIWILDDAVPGPRHESEGDAYSSQNERPQPPPRGHTGHTVMSYDSAVDCCHMPWSLRIRFSGFPSVCSSLCPNDGDGSNARPMAQNTEWRAVVLHHLRRDESCIRRLAWPSTSSAMLSDVRDISAGACRLPPLLLLATVAAQTAWAQAKAPPVRTRRTLSPLRREVHRRRAPSLA